MTFTCAYCDRTFARESTLTRHMCERKRRYLALTEPASRIGFDAFCSFWEIHQRTGQQQTHDTFIRSTYYLAFKRFGNYCVDVRAINSNSFMRWLLRHNIGIDHWTQDRHYVQWLQDYLTIESATDALARALEYSIEWGHDTGMRSQDIMRAATTSRLIHAVNRGSISPWVIYSSSSGQQWLASLSGGDLALIYDFVDADRWSKILLDRTDEACYTRDTLIQAGW